ncbi:MAG: 4Fe-4S binding protein, partial [Candidatus Poribacteria bacterium]
MNSIIPVDLILRLDPLSAIATMLSSRSLIAKFSYSIVIAIVALFFGRFFCGWVCPLGTTIDISDKIFFRRFKRPKIKSLKLR